MEEYSVKKVYLNSKAGDEKMKKFHQKFSMDKKGFERLCDHKLN